jgi:hypothetical protein
MEIQTVSTAHREAPDLLLGDLFVTRADPAAPLLSLPARHAASLALEPLLATGLLPDTLFAGAWLLLQSRWLGSLWPVLHEAGRAHRTSTTAAYDATRAAGDWLAELDQARRAASAAIATIAAASMPDAGYPHALWLRDNIGAAYKEHAEQAAPLHLGYDAARACLHIDTAASLMDAAAAKALLAALADTAADLLARPEAALGDIRTLPREHGHQQLATWNTAVSPLDRRSPCPACSPARPRPRPMPSP